MFQICPDSLKNIMNRQTTQLAAILLQQINIIE